MPRCRFETLVFFVLLSFLVVGSQTGLAAPPPTGVALVTVPAGGFAIDGDLFANTPTANAGDWVINSATGGGVLTASGVPLNASTTFHFTDPFDTSDIIFAGGLKWTDNPTNWSWTVGKANGKTDINNVLLHTATDSSGHSWVAIAADRESTSGDSYIDFELLQNTLTRTGTGGSGGFTSAGPHGGRTTNDLVLSLAFTSGGSVADFFAWRWMANGSGGYAYVDVTTNLPVGRVFVALNATNAFVPYKAFNSTNYAPNAFAEAAVDLTALLGNFDPCLSFGVKTLMVKTKNSQSSSASISDLLDPIQLTLQIGPSANAGPDQTRCTEGASTLFPLNGSATPGLYPIVSTTWSVVSGTATIDSPNSLTTSAHVSSASATLRLTALQANGCTETDDVVLTVAPLPACSITGPSSVCPVSTRQFSATTGMSSYAWSVTGNASISGPTNQQTVSILASSVCSQTFSLSLTVTSNLCSSACTKDVTIGDTNPPSLVLPADRVLECPADTRTNATGVATAQDNCGLVTVSFTDVTTDGCGGTKVIARTWTATDLCGNSTNSVQTITVTDTTKPTITCPVNKTVECTSNWTFDVPAASDTCGSVTITILSTVTNTVGHCGNTFDATRTWRATDACGNTADCSQKVTLVDTTKPTITCVLNKTVECTSAWDFDAPTASDTCGDVTITILSTATNTVGRCGNTFDATRTWRATDACGNTSDCSQKVTLVDTTKPTITCVPNKTVEYGNVWSFDAPTASDTCGTVTITILNTVTNTAGHCGNTFDATRTWRATDACGNTADCSQTVTVEDHTPPTLTCVAAKTVECTSPWDFNPPTATDIGGTVTITIFNTVTNTAGHCGNTFDATRTWRAIDACGNTTDCSQQVTLVDTTKPTITCVPNKSVECTSPWAFDEPTASDTCGTVTITILNTVTNLSGHCGNTLDATRTWRATDACGNTADCSQKVTVVDTTKPTITCVPNKTIEFGSTWGFDVPTASDTCGTVTIAIVSTVTNTVGHCGNTFDATRTWRATDACGNTAECSQKVTVEDHTPPTLTCVSAKTVECTSVWTFDPPTATDIGGNVTIAILNTVTNTSGHCGNTFDATRTWRATDACGNTSDCSQTVTVEDHTPPSITCVPNKTIEYGSIWNFDAPTASDTCGTVTIAILNTVTNTAGHCGNTFDVTRTWRAIDACGNTADCSQKVTLEDHTPPTITCVSNKSVECTSTWGFDPPSASDIGGNVTITILNTVTNTAGHCGNTFDATRIWRATDACGNTADCSQTVTIVDTTKPTITCVPNKTVEYGNPWAFDAPTASDTCGTVTITILNTVTNTAGHCGNTFDTTRTWRATDACGNTADCSQTVTIEDHTPPAITCVANKSVECTSSWAFDPPTSTDTGGSVTITILNTVTNTAGHCGNTFAATRTWRATDACGNTADCSQTVMLEDHTPPTITCVPNKTVEYGSTWTFNPPTASDTCGTVTVTILNTVTNTAGHCGNTFEATRTWRATDACGNTAECSQTVTVEDHTPPTLTCVSAKTVECTSPWTFDPPTATDIGGNVTITILNTVTNTAGHCGNTFDATRTWRATDACGNTTDCSQKVTLVDTTKPTINCVPNQSVEYASTWDFDPPTASDTCGTATITILNTVTNTAGHCGNTFDVTRTWRATDACGNTADCSQKVTVEDHTPPTITCVSAKTVECTSIWTYDPPTATDIGGNVTIAILNTATNRTGHCGNTFDATRTWRATDACGNTADCSQTVTVEDHTAPVISCVSNKTVECSSNWSFNTPTATDTCGSATITIVSTVTNFTGHCGNTFDATRTWRATDACGNFAECSQTVTLQDTTKPVINCVGNKTVECTNPWAFDPPTASDTCGSVTVTIIGTVTNFTGHCGNTFDATRTWRATDDCGNTADCSQKVTLVDTTKPSIFCVPNKTAECSTPWAFDPPTASDTCGTVTITVLSTLTNTTAHCGGSFDVTRSWRATDACGNTADCSQKVTLEDHTPPTIACPPDVTRECGSSTAPASTGTATAQDTCGAVSVTFTDAVTNLCGGSRVITRTWKATDGCGNMSTCVQTITVRDTTPPALTLPANRVLECPGDTRTNVTGVAVALDVCSSVTLTYSDVVSNSCGLTKTVLRQWTAIDACGNSTNGLQTITVVDTRKPSIAIANIAVQCTDDVPAPHASLAAFLAAGGTASDTCSPTLTFSLTSDSGLVGRCPGTVTRVYRVTDECGNFGEVTQRITVDDTIPPVLTCPTNAIAECSTSLDPSNTGRPTATDNCSTNISITYSDAQVQSSYSVNFYAADPEPDHAPYLPTYVKLAPASLPCPASAALTGRAADPLRNAVAFGPSYNTLDALTSLSGEGMYFGQVVPFEAVITMSGAPGPERGTIEFSAGWSTHTTSNDELGFDKNYMVYCAFVDTHDPGAIDPDNNARVDSYSAVLVNPGTGDEQIKGTFRVSGLDVGDQVVVEIWVVLKSTAQGHAGGGIAAQLDSAAKYLNPPVPVSIGSKTISINANKISTLPAPQQQPPLGPPPTPPPQPPGIPLAGRTLNLIDRTWTATDDCANSSTCVQRITVIDSTPPAITAPPDLVLECPANTGTNVTGVAVAQDACGTVSELYYSDIVTNGCGGTKVVSRTWTTTDDSGNSTNVVQTITVVDTTKPSITCPANTTVECTGDTSPATQGSATASDACGSVAITHTDAFAPGCGNSGVITRTWKATDECGNFATCDQTITVVDTTKPSILCPANTIAECTGDTSPATQGSATGSDSCGHVTISHTDAFAPGCGNTRVITRTWKATDDCGNFATCNQTITVVDTTKPSITCPANTTVECTGDTSPATQGSATGSDTCGSVVISHTDAFAPGCGNTGVITRTWKATDNCGNFATCKQTITIVDTTAPTISDVPDAIVECTGSIDPGATGTATGTDTCGTVTITHSDGSMSDQCGNTGSFVRTWTATDACGNTAQSTQSITIVDTTAPIISDVPDAIVECTGLTDAGATGRATASDTCGSVTVTHSDGPMSDQCGNTGSFVRTWTATDACGNTAQSTQTITIVDTTAPTISDVPDAIVECTGSTDAGATGRATASDTCGSVTVTHSDGPMSDQCGNTGLFVRTWTATDACGNTAQSTQTITIVDTTAPTISDVPDAIVECTGPTDPGATGTATASDTCGSVTVTHSDGPMSDLCGNTGSFVRTWTATDACGNTSHSTQTITIVDTTAPTISDVPDAVVECTGSTDPSATGTATASDTCGSVTVTYSDGPMSDQCGNTGSFVRTWTATDACGNKAQSTQTITIVDTTAPTISDVPDAIVECTGSTDPGATGTATASDTCGSVTVTHSDGPMSDQCGNTGSFVRTWTATDACGNTARSTQTITLVDTTAPTISDVSDAIVECTGSIDPSGTGTATASDTCGSVTVTHSDGPMSDQCGNTGSFVRTWTATDSCGNTSHSTQTITIVDTTAPTISDVSDAIVECTGSIAPSATGTATASDTCGSVTVTHSDGPTTDQCGNTGSFVRTWTATDACGNKAQSTQTITIIDTTAPTISDVPDAIVECTGSTDPGATGTATASDTCGSVTVTHSDGPMSDQCGNTGSFVRTWTATDACGNTAQSTQTITIVDTTAPTISDVPDAIVECTGSIDPNAIGAATGSDTCGSVNVTHSDGPMSDQCGNTGSFIRTWTATDACGNTAQSTQTITIVDTTTPTISDVPDAIVECTSSTDPSATGTATGSDTCGAVTITHSDGPMSDQCGNTGSFIRTWTATDACGNTAQSTQTISLVDTTAPTITCAPNQTVECGSAWSFNAPTASDTCGNVTIAVVGTVTNLTGHCGNTFDATRTWRATDACGNIAECSQTVTVEDHAPPTITCVPNKTVECTSTWSFDAPTASDTCGTVTITIVSTVTNLTGHCGNTFDTTRTWRATDACGNTAECSQTVSVEDHTPPTLTCVPNKTVECSSPWSFDSPTASDTCGAVTLTVVGTVTNRTGHCGNTFDATRTWRATDACGNTAECSQTVTLEDHTPPTIACSPNKTVECVSAWSFNAPTASDACGNVTITILSTVTNLTGHCGNTFDATRTWRATDACGNTAECSQTVTVEDHTPPTITCAPNKTVECGSAWSFNTPTAADACGSAPLTIVGTVTNYTGQLGNTFAATRTWRATDACGNTAECSQTVTVADRTPPVITCVSNKIVECGTDWNLDVPTVTDACGNATIAILSTVTNVDALIGGQYDLKFYVADPDSGTGPYAPTYLKFAPGSLPCPDSAMVSGRALDPLRNAVAFSPSGALDALMTVANTSVAYGQIVPFEVVIQASGGPGRERGTIEFTADWSTYTTSNQRFGYNTNYMVHCAFVDAADPGSIDPKGNARVDSFSSVVINRDTIAEKIRGTFRVSGLDDGDRVIVEIWMVLDGATSSHFGSNVAADLVSAQKLSDPPVPINVGAQTDSISVSKIGELPPPQEQPPLGPLPPQPPALPGETISVIDRTWIATDDSGNTSTCVQRITVRDTSPPTLSVPADLVLDCPADTRSSATGMPVAQDACGSARLSYTDIVSNGCGTNVISRVWTATDDYGNSTNAVQTITVRDTSPPVLTCAPNKTVECGSNWSFDAPAATDACGSATITIVGTVTNFTGHCARTFDAKRTWRATDGCGNRVECSQTVTVEDHTPPAITCVPNKIVECTSAWSFDAPTANDACGDVALTIVGTVTNLTGHCGNTFDATRTWRATDACGNTAECSQTVTVEDHTPPTITCAPSKTVECNSAWSFDAPTASDACGNVTLTIVGTVTNLTGHCGNTFDATRTWRATDACGNTAECSQTVKVEDHTPPTLACASSKTVECTSAWSFDAPTASDACGNATITIVGTVTNLSGQCANAFNATRTWRATDACGNTAECSQTVTVEDHTPPNLTCAPNKTVECNSAWSFDAPTASDACGNVTLTILSTVTNLSGQCANAFDATRTWRATDACGNTAECSQTVSVQDTTPPGLTCKPDRFVQPGVAWSFDDPVAADACSDVTVLVINTVTNTIDSSTMIVTRTWQATDACGNSTTCQQAITVSSGQPPVITSQPLSQTRVCGSDAILSVTATGSVPMTYQWRCNHTDLAGATNSSLTFTSLAFTNAGLYDVVVRNPVGAVTSSTAQLTVVDPPDTTAPTVSATVPGNGATGVGISGQIAATFSEPMGATTINTTTFTLNQGATPVAGTVNYSGITATFTPAGNLAPLTTYTATITGARDLAGNALPANFVWSFTTGIAPDTTAPTVSATVPANTASGVGLSAQIASTFSEAMDASTINTSTFTLKQGTTPVAGTVNYSGITATFTPAGNLAPLTTYTATITGARDLAGNALAADFVWSFTTGIAPDTTAPTVSATVPANTASGVGLSAQIASTFSEAMDASTINTSTFTLKQGTTLVAGTVNYSGITATFTPAGNLAPLTTYTATITGARDLAGNALPANFVWSFTTGIAPDTTTPTVSATVPANTASGVGLSAQIASTFSEAMDAATINTSSFTLRQGTTPVAGTVNYSGITATFTPAGNLAPLTTYTATITGARDLAGNALAADFVWSFTTGIAPDTTAPTVSATVPANTASGVGLSAQIASTFSEAMDAATINTSSFTLRQGTTPVAGTVNYSGITATFTPAGNLAPLTTYTATITGARDLAGNALAADFVWSFTTGDAPDTTAPVLSATGPANADANVPLNETIVASFSEAMDPSTINTSTVTVMQGTTPVAGTVTYVNGAAIFTPAATLAPLTTYTVTISTGATDLAGNALSTDLSWSFTTGVAADTTAPTASVIFPANTANGVAVSAQLATIFSEAMDPSTINTSTFTLMKGATPVAGMVNYADGIATFTPADTLAPLTTYTATISRGATDLAGNPLSTDTSWSFTTGIAPDTTAPVLSATGPANDATNVPLNETIAVSFSEVMDPSSINTSTFTVMQGTTPVAGAVTYTNGTAIFTPAATLASLTTYTVTISTGATDLAGNALSTDLSWSFTTGVAPDTTAPVLSATGPANEAANVPLNETITVSFSEAMDPSSINTSTYTVMQGTTPVAGTVTYVNGTAIFTPAATLAPLTTYTVTISTGATDLAGNALSTDLSWSFTTGVAADTTAPVLGAIGPANDATNVPLNETITVSFSEAMDPSSINTNTFTVMQGTTPVAGTVTYVNGTAIFTPAATLAPLTTYTVTISTGATDLAGNALSTDTSWSFTSGVAPDTTAPVLSATGPANEAANVPLNETITVSFSEVMDPSSINTSTFTVMQGTTPVAGAVTYVNGTAIFTPAATLAPLTTYTVTISTEATDLAGNALSTDMSWSFTTGVAPDTTAPVLGATGPANAATNVPLNETITVSFSEAMDPSSINTSTFTVMQGTTPVAGAVTYTNGTAIFTPAATLAPLTTYTVTISTEAKDLAGNPLSTDMSWSFTTVSSTLPIVLESAAQPAGPYTDAAGQVVDLVTKIITVPQSGSMQFYRIRSTTADTITAITISGNNVVLTYK